MINSNDLRLGNLVYNEKGDVYTITWLNKDIINLIEPIPITKEYLLRCGFVNNDDYEFDLLLGSNSEHTLYINATIMDGEDYDSGDNIIGYSVGIGFVGGNNDFENNDGFWWTYGSKPYNKEGVYYVHELQNLYYTLMGKELVFSDII